MRVLPRRASTARTAVALAAGLLVWAVGPTDAQEGGGAGVEPRRETSRGWIGVGLQPRARCPSEEECRRALLVETVVVGEPADRAGILPGDTIFAVNGRSVFDGTGELRLPPFRPGEPLAVSVGTSAGRRTAIVRPSVWPDEPGLVPVKVRTRERRAVLLRPEARAGGDASSVTVRVAPIGAVRPPRAPERWPAEPAPPDPQLDRIRDSVLSAATAYLDSVRGSFRAELRRRYEREGSLPGARRDMDRIEGGIDRRFRERIEEMTRRLAEVFRAHRVWERRGKGERPAPAGRRAALEERLRGALRAGGGPAGAGSGLGEIAPEGVARMAGAELYPLTAPLAEQFDGTDAGLLVLRVIPGTLAAEAGLRPGDVIVEAAGLPVSQPVELRAVLLEHPARDSTVVRWIRRGRVVEGLFREGG